MRSHRLCGGQCVSCDVKAKGTGDLNKAGENLSQYGSRVPGSFQCHFVGSKDLVKSL